MLVLQFPRTAETSDRAATQSLSSVVNLVLNNTQRSAGQFFSEQTVSVTI